MKKATKNFISQSKIRSLITHDRCILGDTGSESPSDTKETERRNQCEGTSARSHKLSFGPILPLDFLRVVPTICRWVSEGAIGGNRESAGNHAAGHKEHVKTCNWWKKEKNAGKRVTWQLQEKLHNKSHAQ